MKYILKPHAKNRVKERSIPESMIREALENPTTIGYDAKGRWLVKKLYRRNRKEILLLLVGEITRDTLEIITVIDTSKVRKYL